MRIVVVGASGNVGTALLRRLQKERSVNPEIELVGVSRRVPDSSKAPFEGVLWHSLDVGAEEDRHRLNAALKGADAVVHLAWQVQPNHDLDQLHRTNVTGTANMLSAAKEAGVKHIVCASSIGAYSRAASKESRVDESWPADGIPGSHYSRHKAEQEALLDNFMAENPAITVARLRPGLTFQRDAGSEIGRYFLGPLIPKLLLGSARTPILPVPPQFVFQAAHADDVADAFNIAAEPVVTPQELGRLFHAKRWLPIPVRMVHAAADLSWRLHLQRTDAGWVDMAEGVPIMDTTRAREVLGWEPRVSSLDAIRDVLAGLGTGQGIAASPAMHPRPLLGPASLRKQAMRKVALRSGALRSEALRRHALRTPGLQ
jgi:nucleoside-diphosphate-sugar epimerase